MLNGPVQNALFCFMDLCRTVCVSFMARNCRFPQLGTHPCQRGNHRLLLQGTASSQRLELLVVNFGIMGCHGKQLLVPRGWNSSFDPGNNRLPLQKNFWSLKLGTDRSQHGNQRLPWQGTAGSQRLELLGTRGYHYKESEFPSLKGWN